MLLLSGLLNFYWAIHWQACGSSLVCDSQHSLVIFKVISLFWLLSASLYVSWCESFWVILFEVHQFSIFVSIFFSFMVGCFWSSFEKKIAFYPFPSPHSGIFIMCMLLSSRKGLLTLSSASSVVLLNFCSIFFFNSVNVFFRISVWFFFYSFSSLIVLFGSSVCVRVCVCECVFSFSLSLVFCLCFL